MDRGAESYKRYLSGDDGGLVELITDYKDGLMLYLRGITESIDLAEDLMQETFVKLATKRPKFSERSSFKTWLYTIAHNLAMDYFRSKKHFLDVEDETVENISDVHLLEEEYIRSEQQREVHKYLMKLSPDYRQVLYLSFFEDLKNEEIATVMRKTKRQVENLIYRAKGALKEEMLKGGFSL